MLTSSLSAAAGLSITDGIVVYQIAQSAGGGLSRIEMGRLEYRHATRPSLVPAVYATLKHLVIVDLPLYFNVASLMGLTAFDSDDDDDVTEIGKHRQYFLDWVPEDRVRLHTIDRATGQKRVWELPIAFYSNHGGTAYDAEGAHWWRDT